MLGSVKKIEQKNAIYCAIFIVKVFSLVIFLSKFFHQWFSIEVIFWKLCYQLLTSMSLRKFQWNVPFSFQPQHLHYKDKSQWNRKQKSAWLDLHEEKINGEGDLLYETVTVGFCLNQKNRNFKGYRLAILEGHQNKITPYTGISLEYISWCNSTVF